MSRRWAGSLGVGVISTWVASQGKHLSTCCFRLCSFTIAGHLSLSHLIVRFNSICFVRPLSQVWYQIWLAGGWDNTGMMVVPQLCVTTYRCIAGRTCVHISSLQVNLHWCKPDRPSSQVLLVVVEAWIEQNQMPSPILAVATVAQKSRYAAVIQQTWCLIPFLVPLVHSPSLRCPSLCLPLIWAARFTSHVIVSLPLYYLYSMSLLDNNCYRTA